VWANSAWRGKLGQGKITEESLFCLKITLRHGDDSNCNWTWFREHSDICSLNLKTGKETRMPGFMPGKTF
jgi:hypothetical protein